VLILAIALVGGFRRKEDFHQYRGMFAGADANEANAPALARALHELEASPEIDDSELVDIVDRLREKALAGDVDAARVIAELALLQRAGGDAAPVDSAGESAPDGPTSDSSDQPSGDTESADRS